MCIERKSACFAMRSKNEGKTRVCYFPDFQNTKVRKFQKKRNLFAKSDNSDDDINER